VILAAGLLLIYAGVTGKSLTALALGRYPLAAAPAKSLVKP
jgi:hypothetical protein